MGDNQERRMARRQQRGIARQEEILRAAGDLFAEVGYDKATTNLVAERAAISPGSLYQFFPNKEAIAQAYAAAAVTRLHQVYDALLAPPVIDLPLPAFADHFVDELLDFNAEFPGYLALALASTLSATLAGALTDLQREVFGRLDAVLAAFWPSSTREQRQVPVVLGQRVFVAALPLTRVDDPATRDAVVRELKTLVVSYWGALIASTDSRLDRAAAVDATSAPRRRAGRISGAPP